MCRSGSVFRIQIQIRIQEVPEYGSNMHLDSQHCFQASIVDNFGILANVQVLIADNFEISVQIQALIADDFGIFNTIGKNKHNPGLEIHISGITSCHSTNCATNSLRVLYIKRDTTHNTGDVRQETWDRRGETGNLRQET